MYSFVEAEYVSAECANDEERDATSWVGIQTEPQILEHGMDLYQWLPNAATGRVVESAHSSCCAGTRMSVANGTTTWGAVIWYGVRGRTPSVIRIR